ncbi:MAG: TrpB-like pyridoxal phosphate-dependent enzyme [Bacillota bacterium]|nr:TrpB-like pyridoxal phosphate-dependent enzyme [Bacillota bacterium]
MPEGHDAVKFLLRENDIPTAWYNIVPDLPFDLDPPLHPRTLQPLGPEDLLPLFPMALIEQEVSRAPAVDVPGRVLDLYRQYRPAPLFRARRLEQVLNTPARIYYKYEGLSPVGSHKANTSIAQAYYNHCEGVRRLATETGAGQWGSALAMACAMFGLECSVYMVRVSYDQKPYRKAMMRVYGADVTPSPSPKTAAGRAILASDPESPGSLGIAISEAVEDAVAHEDTKYSLGSVLNHVLLHQTVIGLEAQMQMEMAGDRPDVLVGCVGGGSNFAGLAFPFLKPALAAARRRHSGTAQRAGQSTPQGPRVIAVEPTACPTLTRGTFGYDYGDTACLAPVAKMYTLGHGFVPAGIHAGGLRYHGAAPILSALVRHGFVEARAVRQLEVFESAVTFARSEGILPAPESAHAVRVAVDLALEARETGASPAILFGLSGHGHFDLGAYESYFAGQLKDYDHPQAEIDRALASLPKA